MPSKRVYDQLSKKGYNPENDPYLKFDTLESQEDLTNLFEVLASVKGKNGQPVKLTANTIVANPDFEKIKANNFLKYYYEPVNITLNRYPKREKVFKLWQEGQRMGIYHPQYHGREHLNVDQWLKELRSKNERLREAFHYEMISISSCPSHMRFNFMEGLDYFTEDERATKNLILREGAELFNNIFGYKSKSFIANCYIWDKSAEKTLSELGIKYLQGIVNQIVPTLGRKGHHHRLVKHYLGQRNKYGQYYLIRNAFFEPSLMSNPDIVEECLNRVRLAFYWKKPAIICSHRLNFIGSIHVENRDKNLQLFKALLKKIVSTWPDVEFMSSDELGQLISLEKESTEAEH